MNRTSARPKVSVIVPVYNAFGHLADCVSSVLAQDYRNLELVLVDDGSTDGSGELCDDFARTDARVRVIHRENGGIAAAQNAGLDAATGDLLTFCDHDDLMSPRMIGRLVQILQDAGADMSCCRWRNVGESVAEAAMLADRGDAPGRVAVFSSPGRYYQTVFSIAVRRLTGQELKYFSEANWGKLYRRELFDGLRFPEHRYAQDVAVAMDLYRRMRLVASCSDPLYYWVQHPGSVSHRLRAAAYYHDIVQAHGRCFDIAVGEGILPARATFGMTALRFEKRNIASDSDRAVYELDRRAVAARLASLTRRQRLACAVLRALRWCEVQVYDRTVHRRS